MSAFLVGLGLLLVFFGALGAAILPDIFLRLHASTKCGVTGAVTVLIGLMLRAGSPGAIARLLLILLFLVLTAPLIPHLLGMAYLQKHEPPEDAP